MLLVALLIVTGVKQVVYADDSTPTNYSATDYSSFKEALEMAKDGDTIMVHNTITIKSDIDIGSAEKSLIIKRATAKSSISFSGGGNNVKLENVIFDGGGYKAISPFVYAGSYTSVFKNCTFQNCGDCSQYLSCTSYGGAVRVDSGINQFVNCQFKDNAAMTGGHMDIYGGTVQITGCTFTGGAALSNGGAICVTGDTAQCVINSSIISGNQAGDFGGGISNMGKLTIDDSMIYDNIATNGGADIANKTFGTIELQDTIEQLAELFEPEKILPVAWVCDYDFEENIYIPDVDPYQENALLKLQYEIIPDDNEEESTEPGTETVDPSEPSTDDTEQIPSDEDENTDTTETPTDPSDSEGTDTDDIEDAEEPSIPTEPGTDVSDDSDQDTTPDDCETSEPSQSVGDTNTDNSTHTDNSNNSVNTDNSNNSVNTDNSDNSTHTDNSDNSSVDNSKVDNSNVNNNSDSSTTTTNTTTTTNNYYTTESNQASGQAAAQPIVVQVQNDSVVPDTDDEKVSESGSSTPNIRIDAQGVDCVFEYVDGVYNISITAQKETGESDAVIPAVAAVQAVENSTDQEVDWLGIIQIVLLVAILICLIWQPQRTGNRNIQG